MVHMLARTKIQQVFPILSVSNLLLFPDQLLSTSTTSPSWLDSVLGQSKQGVFTADFEGENNTVMELGDGDNTMLDCKVFLKQEKTVSLSQPRPTLKWQYPILRYLGYDTQE